MAGPGISTRARRRKLERSPVAEECRRPVSRRRGDVPCEQTATGSEMTCGGQVWRRPRQASVEAVVPVPDEGSLLVRPSGGPHTQQGGPDPDPEGLIPLLSLSGEELRRLAQQDASGFSFLPLWWGTDALAQDFSDFPSLPSPGDMNAF